MKEEYQQIIEEYDKTLSMLREEWMSEKDKSKALVWIEKINQFLDERLRLMKLRDK